MQKFNYLGYTFEPFGNIIGKSSETRFHNLMRGMDTANPILSAKDGYSHEDFYKIAGKNSADIYFVPEENSHYIPTGGGICRIDVNEIKKHIRAVQVKPEKE